MNPREQEDAEFDKLADGKLRQIDRALAGFDPDEVECYLGGDILNLTLSSGSKVVINRHRAARQIWMAAQRRAWHFDYDAATSSWRTKDDELVCALERVLSESLKRPIKLKLA